MSNKKTVQCAFSHMDMWENLFSFTDYSKKAIKTQDQSLSDFTVVFTLLKTSIKYT